MNITKENIEVILYDYAEGNLSDKERKETEQYLNLHPEYKEMLDEYDPLLKIPEENDVVFANKEEFLQQIMTSKPYITTEKPQSEQKKLPKIITITRYIKWISGAAAMLLLLIAIGSVFNLQNTTQTASIDGKNEISIHNNLKTTNKTSSEYDKDIAQGQLVSATSQKSIKKTGYFLQKDRVFSTKRPPLFDIDSESSESEVQYSYNESQYLAENNARLNQENEEMDTENFGIMTFDGNLTEDNENFAMSDGQYQMSNADYEDYEYRIIFFNNKPTVWKRIKRWFSNAKDVLFAEN